jgi:hypothetical protein
VIRGNTTDGQEFTLWLFVYRQIGEAEFITDEDLFQLTFIHGNFSPSQKSQMSDTSFVNIGQDVEDYAPIGTLKTEYNQSQVAYTFDNFTLTTLGTGSSKKTWEAKGSRGGVAVDLAMEQRGQEDYHAGAFSDLEGCSPNTTSSNYNCTGFFGGIVHMDVTGTLSFNGSTITIDQAYGVHERIMQAGSVPSRIETCSGTGALWLHGWGKQLSYFAFTTDFGPLAESMVVIGDESFATSGIQNTSIESTGTWFDPKTNQVNPYKWHAFTNLPNGRMDSYVTSYGRLYYYWLRKAGMILVHQYIADAETTFTYNNGTIVSESQVAFMEYFRTIYISTPGS